ncbi:MAG TPA: LysR family transcriptional regulator [Albitalea sp.]|uniref:LysR family transcriptional regulator n=1 Tax=Piscinibacter sp. TaxID=1903157 RepID=UPI002ED1FB92
MLNPSHLARVDINLLVLFHVVFEEGNVGRAADRLRLTSSAVSHGLARLRRLLDDPLFLRTPKGIVPTARALALRAPIAEILSLVQSVLHTAVPFDPATSSRRFVIGAPDAVLASTATSVLKRLGTVAPGVDIGLIHLMPQPRDRLTDNPWGQCLHQIEQREVDVALLPISELPPRFEAQWLYDEDFVVAMRKGHPFARDPTEANFCAANHLLVSSSADPHGFVDEALRKRGRKRRVALTAPSFMVALEHVAHSDLLVTLPRQLVRQHAARFGLAAVELPVKRKPDPIQAVTTKAAMLDAGVAWLMATLVGLFARRR